MMTAALRYGLPRVVLVALVCIASTEQIDAAGIGGTHRASDSTRRVMRSDPLDDTARRTLQRVDHEHGSYVRYIPEGTLRGLLVIVHGSISQDGSALNAAQTFAERWTVFADRNRFAVIAPAFDDENFGGHAGPGGGYRGLFGRRVGADVFVNAIVDQTRQALPTLPETFMLYGHSAGGQFVSRYLVTHPQRVRAAVISAAGTFAFPDPDVTWTNGMRTLTRRIRWSDDEAWKEIEITPDPHGWMKAAQIPIAVVVGSRDTAEIKAIPGNPGRSHVERARAWVDAMQKHAADEGHASRVVFVQVADVGHNSAQLTPRCQQALLEGFAVTADVE